MIFQSIKTSDLSEKKLNQILKLKDTHWSFGIKSQKHWYEKKIKNNDLHNLMISKNKIVGYTSLSFRKFKIIEDSGSVINKNYILFSTFILKKNYRNFINASKMMKFNNKTILSKNKGSFLLCYGDKIDFYKFFGWSIIKKSNFQVLDHKHNLSGMIYNLKDHEKKKFRKYNFFYYR